jgi:hypothetical protein
MASQEGVMGSLLVLCRLRERAASERAFKDVKRFEEISGDATIAA